MSNTAAHPIAPNKITDLRNLFEGGVDYHTAIAMVGIKDTDGARFAWGWFGRNYRH